MFLSIADAPICSTIHEELLGALKHETLTLKCEVDASPPADSFHWTFNSSGEPTDLPARLHSSEVWTRNRFEMEQMKSKTLKKNPKDIIVTNSRVLIIFSSLFLIFHHLCSRY